MCIQFLQFQVESRMMLAPDDNMKAAAAARSSIAGHVEDVEMIHRLVVSKLNGARRRFPFYNAAIGS